MKSNPDIIIVGSGLFGSMTAKYFRKKGLECLIIDNKQPMAASKCSFGVWKEGWINEKIRAEVDISLPILQEFFTIEEKEFFNMDKQEVEVMSFLDCSQILNEPFEELTVKSIVDKRVICSGVDEVLGEVEVVLNAKKAVIVCAGIWTAELLSNYSTAPKLDNHYGATLEFKQKIDMSRFGQWAPYRQNVLLKLSEKKFVFGDGATVKNPKDNDERVKKVSDRLVTHAADTIGTLNPENISKVNEGYRPYLAKGGSGKFVNKHDEGLYSATGGAKNSTILCGFIAQELYRLVVPPKKKAK